MAEKGLSESASAAAGAARPPPLFKTSPSAAELASGDTEGYAEPGLAEHKASPGGHHLEPHWHKGRGGLRPEGEDYQEEEERLHELEERAKPGLVQRAREAVGAAVYAVAGAVLPSYFKSSPSAAELAAQDAEGYAEPGLAEHKASPGGHHLEPHWHKGAGGLRPEGEDYQEEQERLHELEAHKTGGVVQRATEAVKSTAAAATEKAGGALQAAKEMVGMAEPKK